MPRCLEHQRCSPAGPWRLSQGCLKNGQGICNAAPLTVFSGTFQRSLEDALVPGRIAGTGQSEIIVANERVLESLCCRVFSKPPPRILTACGRLYSVS